MATITVSDELQTFIDSEILEHGFATASEYVSYLVRQEQKRRAKEQLGALLLGGAESGESLEITAEAWQNLRLKRVAGR
jgi:Arc/MetJ-type ribon-helix-helix transcriptional regulator